MAKGKNQHVVPRGNGRWGVLGEGNSRDTAQFDTQYEAIEAARQIAQNQETELVIHGVDGRIRERNSYAHAASSLAGLVIEGELAASLRKRPTKQHPLAEPSLESMIDALEKRAAETSPLEAFIGMFDDDVTDLSIKATRHMGDYYQKKHDDSD